MIGEDKLLMTIQLTNLDDEEKKQEISQDYSTLRNELAQLLHITISCVEVKQKSR